MPIPDQPTIAAALLESIADGREHRMGDVVEVLAERFRLTESERREVLRTGGRRFDKRVWWARLALKGAGLLESPRRGSVRITEKGRELAARGLARIPVALLERESSRFREWRRTTTGRVRSPRLPRSDESPEETMARAHRLLTDQLAEELLEAIKSCSPSFFERLVVDLLVKLGYGGSQHDAASAIGGSGDAGIDGVIKQDALGLDTIYVQAKRWDGVVGRPELQKFAGALEGQGARRGVFITTGAFSREALDYARRIGKRIVPVDGRRLVELMIEHNVGVTPLAAYEIKRIDRDYFEED